MLTTKGAISVVPSIGKKFPLTLINGREFDPIRDMVAKWGYKNPPGWQFTGLKPLGTSTEWFKLLWVPPLVGIQKVREELYACNAVPAQGIWLVAFEKEFPRYDGRGLIAIADPAWIDCDGEYRFPVLFKEAEFWDPALWPESKLDYLFQGRYPPRWLVEADPPSDLSKS